MLVQVRISRPNSGPGPDSSLDSSPGLSHRGADERLSEVTFWRRTAQVNTVQEFLLLLVHANLAGGSSSILTHANLHAIAQAKAHAKTLPKVHAKTHANLHAKVHVKIHA